MVDFYSSSIPVTCKPRDMHYHRLSMGPTWLFLTPILIAAARDTRYIYGTSVAGITEQLAIDRTPALYTGDFGDCLSGHGLFEIIRFDAAYYTDNSTVLFHLDGASDIEHDSLMMRFSMYAYGESRFQMTFDPCSVNIHSLCPLNASVPVTAWAVFAVGPAQVGDIPPIAFTIPDFEGSVRLQIFANSTGAEVGCFQASLRNGVTLGYPQVISPVLAMFASMAVFASFATAAYGISMPHMRTHYAHSISAMVVLETFQSIFFSGALSVNFPSVLVAWWSNFTWSTGQIYSHLMVKAVDSFSGVSGNASQAAQQMYEPTIGHSYNASDQSEYTWSGNPINPGVQLPGASSGFPGTLAASNLPAADACMIGLLWLLVLLGLMILNIAAFKWTLEVLVRMTRIEKGKMTYFRTHWISYTILAILRTLYMAFSMMMVLTFHQFSFGGSAGAKAIAAVILLVFLLGIGGLAAYACRLRLKHGRYVVQQDRIQFVRGKILRVVPYVKFARRSVLREAELPRRPVGSFPFIRFQPSGDDADRINVHQDQAFVKRSGWLSARYRRTRWWFFGCHLVYQLVRAAFVGGASATPLAQIYGLLVFEILTLAVVVKLDPFEGQRNTALAVWMLGISKVVTTGLSVAFLPSLNLNRIVATGIGFVIVIVQGLLVLGLMILVVLGAISSYMSLTRNSEDFKPEKLESTRVKYFEYLQAKALDVHIFKKAEENAPPPEASFSVKSVKRMSKIEDEDEDTVGVLDASFNDSNALNASHRNSRTSWHDRTNGASSRLSTHRLPRAATPHRMSWSSRDFADCDALSLQRPESGLARRLSEMSVYGLTLRNSMNAVTTYITEEPDHPGCKEGRAERNAETSTPTTPTRLDPSSSNITTVGCDMENRIPRRNPNERLSGTTSEDSRPTKP